MVLALPFPAIDPVIVEIGPFALRWYALSYIAGIALGWWYAGRLLATPRLWPQGAPMSREALDDFIVWATLGIVLGGRIGYVLFYQPEYFLENPARIFAVWQGGMSFHGGMLGTFAAMALFAWKRGVRFLSLTDVITVSSTFGLFFGRIANFINGELYGRPTDVPWAMVFPGAGPEPRHPSQLYEAALEGLALFLALRVITHYFGAFRRPGLASGVFLVGYGAARSFVELFRMPDAHIGFLASGLTMGQLLSFPMILAGLGIIAYALRRAPAAT